MAKTSLSETVRLPRKMVKELYDASIRVASLVETLEVLMDQQAMRRLKAGEKDYSKHRYVVARGAAQIRKALSS